MTDTQPLPRHIEEQAEPAAASPPPTPAKVQTYAAAHPTAALGLHEVSRMLIPTSYGTARYWAIHDFTWCSPQGERRPVRYRWEPDTGGQELSEQEFWAAQVFDPTRITGGIELSDDPIRAFRSQAYAVSHDRRASGR
jgi:catalase